MQYWPFWAGGLALASVMLAHFAITRRLLAVSGRITALVDRARHGTEAEASMSQEDLVAAMLDATTAAFGTTAQAAEPARVAASSLPRRELPISEHFVFFAAMIAGGALSGALAGELSITPLLRGTGFSSTFGGFAPFVLVLGGVLVGFGTRMAGGCTSGHGLCGVSRGQSGSLLATAAFFGAGVVTSFLLGALS